MGIHTRPRKTTLALFAGVLIMGFLVGPANVAVGQAPEEPVIVQKGTLVLELGAVDRIALYDTGGTVIATQSMTAPSCKLSLATDTILAALAPLPATSVVGFFADGIGVQTKGEKGGNGQPCGQANAPAEGLILKLAGQLGEVKITHADLDIEGKFDALVNADLYNEGVWVASDSLGTGVRSDSGPDSGDGDNYRFDIDPKDVAGDDILFDEIRLTIDPQSSNGAFSLEGGADLTEAGALGFSGSALQLVREFDGVIDCGEPTFTVGDKVDTAEATFVRGDNDAKYAGECTLIGYDLSSTATDDDQTVSFEFETEQAPSWFGTFTWAPEPASIPVPATQVDGADLQWCDGFSGLQDEWGNDIPVMPTGKSWCLVTQTSTLIGLDTIQVTQTIYGLTDPSFTRPR